MSIPRINIESINTAFAPIFTNTANDDMAIYTDTSNQRVHIGCGSNTNNVAPLVVSNSNILISRDISINNRNLNLSRVTLTKATSTSTPTTLTTVVTQIPQINTTNGTNFDLSLAAGQSNFRFCDSNGTVEATITNTGNMSLVGNISAGNLGMFRNRIINGDMRIDQRNNGTQVTNPNGYTIDRMVSGKGSGSAVFRAGQSNINNAVPGFQHAYAVTITTAGTGSLTATSDYNFLMQAIEGVNIADFHWGTAAAQPVTISFWCMSTVNSTFYLSLRNSNVDRSYVAPFTCSANTWTQVVRTIQGDTLGTWMTNSNVGMYVRISNAIGTNLCTNNPNQWVSGQVIAINEANNNTNFVNTLNATLLITGLQVEKGTIATPFELRPLTIEQMLCYRYYSAGILYHFNTVNGSTPGSVFNSTYHYGSEMRSIPTITRTNTVSVNGSFIQQTGVNTRFANFTASVGGGLWEIAATIIANAEI